MITHATLHLADVVDVAINYILCIFNKLCIIFCDKSMAPLSLQLYCVYATHDNTQDESVSNQKIIIFKLHCSKQIYKSMFRTQINLNCYCLFILEGSSRKLKTKRTMKSILLLCLTFAIFISVCQGQGEPITY